MIVAAIFAAALLLAWSNGANDNFKGVASLWGSGTLRFRGALAWATATTLAGSLAAAVAARRLAALFSGAGLVPDGVAHTPAFVLAVLAGAALTVLLATRLGFPVSTTHALTGALVGAGLAAAGSAVSLSALGAKFVVPLAASPVLALALAAIAWPAASRTRRALGLGPRSCLCIEKAEAVSAGYATAAALPMTTISAVLDDVAHCAPAAGAGAGAVDRMRRMGERIGVRVERLLDALHVLSAGAVSFARGLNDTPKIAALALAAAALGGAATGGAVTDAARAGVGATAVGSAAGSAMAGSAATSLGAAAAGGAVAGAAAPHAAILGVPATWIVPLVALVMALGGIVQSRRVARTLSHEITPMNHGQGFVANATTAALVLVASRWGVPVSTTHVSCGALFGIGAASRQARGRVVRNIVLSWVLTLPMAGVLAAAVWTLAS